MARVVHYAAAFRSGLAFDCYRDAIRAHLDSPLVLNPKDVPKFAQSDDADHQLRRWGRHSVPMPHRHTDLRKVTCLTCWAEIAAMAKERRGR